MYIGLIKAHQEIWTFFFPDCHKLFHAASRQRMAVFLKYSWIYFCQRANPQWSLVLNNIEEPSSDYQRPLESQTNNKWIIYY